MNQQGPITRSLPRRTDRSDGAGSSELDWERIMVQITFAFVIILGYLVSVGVDEANQLVAETQSQKQRSAFLENILSELRETDIGEARAGRVAAEREMQLEKLLRIWAQLRVQRPLYALLRQFERAELIPLSGDLRCLPTAESFERLTHEAGRVFLVATQRVSVSEVTRLMKDVLERAGFEPRTSPMALDPELLPAEVATFYFNDEIPASDNLRILKLQIVADLEEERGELDALQYALVGKIAAARRDSLADLPIPDDEQLEIDGADPGIAMLDSIISDLQGQMMLLPEAVGRIRGGVGTDRDQATDSGQPNDD